MSEEVPYYSYNLHYRLAFTGREGTEYVVGLYRRSTPNDPVPKAVDLDGGPTPFLVSLSSDEDLLATRRTSTARISFADDIDLGALLPSDGSQWKVILTRQSDWRALFTGYLTAEVYTQPDIDGPNIVTVNAASPVAMACDATMPLAGLSTLTVGQLLSMAVETAGIEGDIFMPATFSSTDGDGYARYTEPLRMKFSVSLFVEESENADVTGAEFEYGTYGDALDAVCGLLGWTMYDTGDGNLYLVEPGYSGPYLRLSREQLTAAESFTPAVETAEAMRLSSAEAVDTSDTVDFRQGYASVLLTARLQEIDFGLPSVEECFKASAYDTGISYMNFMPKGGGETLQYASRYMTARYEYVKGRCELLRYRLADVVRDGETFTPQWESADLKSQDTADVAGAFLRKYDWYDPSSEDEKLEWSLSTAIEVRDYIIWSNPDGPQKYQFVLPENTPLVRIGGLCGVVSAGAIRIDMSLMALQAPGFWISSNDTWSGVSIPSPLAAEDYNAGLVGANAGVLDGKVWGDTVVKSITASLRIGNLYWTGSSWSEEFAYFWIPIETEDAQWHGIRTNKTIDMPYSGSSGLYIEIDRELSGELELCLYTPFTETASYDVRFYIRDLTVEYMTPIEWIDSTQNNVRYYRDFGTRFTERAERSLTLHSRVNDSIQMSLLYAADGQPLDTLRKATSLTEEKPERFLLDELQRLYGRAFRRLRRGMALRELRPCDYFVGEAGTMALVVAGCETDYADETMGVVLAEVPVANNIES